ncbi:MAG: CHASE2 domain-containing protein [Candidatus Eisenbacteria bacterium]
MVSDRAAGRSRFVRGLARLLGTTEKRIEVWGRLIMTSLAVTLLVHGARSQHLLDGAETWWLDKMAVADRPGFDAPITVVAITDADYYDPALFGGTSPLDPGVVARILERILDHRPRGVVLDIQIHPARHESPERSESRLRLFRMLEDAAEAGGAPIVLVRESRAEEIEFTPGDPPWSAWEELTGRAEFHFADPTIERSGGFVRAVPRRYDGDDGEARALPTILGAAVSAFHLVPHRDTPWWIRREEQLPTTPWRIRFSGQFLRESPGITPYHTDVTSLVSAPAVEGARSLLTDRIVLLGGTHHAGRDIQPTVVGDMPGIYVWAEAIASWIRHDALREPLASISFLLEFLLGVVAGFVLARFGPAFSMLISLLVMAPLTVLFSILTFGDGVLFVNFLPSILGVYLHYQIEVHIELRHCARLRESLRGDSPGRVPESPSDSGEGSDAGPGTEA